MDDGAIIDVPSKEEAGGDNEPVSNGIADEVSRTDVATVSGCCVEEDDDPGIIISVEDGGISVFDDNVTDGVSVTAVGSSIRVDDGSNEEDWPVVKDCTIDEVDVGTSEEKVESNLISARRLYHTLISLVDLKDHRVRTRMQ